MHYDKPDRLLLGEQKNTTEILNEIRSLAKKKSDNDFADFVAQNQNEFSYSPQVGRYIRDVLQNRFVDTNILPADEKCDLLVFGKEKEAREF